VPVLLSGVIGGMCWAAITAWLRDRFHANEILVSLMLVYVAMAAILAFRPRGLFPARSG
jgi:simple sugar transport system permease protein